MRQVLTKKRTAVLNAFHKVPRKHNLEQDRPTRLFQTKKVRQWLASLPEVWFLNFLRYGPPGVRCHRLVLDSREVVPAGRHGDRQCEDRVIQCPPIRP